MSKEIHLRLYRTNNRLALIERDSVFGGDLFNLLIEDTPGRIKLLVSNTSLILRGLDFSMCPFDNEVSVIRAFNFRVVLPNSSLQFIDSISQLEYFVLIIIVLYDESITVNLSTLS